MGTVAWSLLAEARWFYGRDLKGCITCDKFPQLDRFRPRAADILLILAGRWQVDLGVPVCCAARKQDVVMVSNGRPDVPPTPTKPPLPAACVPLSLVRACEGLLHANSLEKAPRKIRREASNLDTGRWFRRSERRLAREASQIAVSPLRSGSRLGTKWGSGWELTSRSLSSAPACKRT